LFLIKHFLYERCDEKNSELSHPDLGSGSDKKNSELSHTNTSHIEQAPNASSKSGVNISPASRPGTMISGFKQKAADLAELPFKSRN